MSGDKVSFNYAGLFWGRFQRSTVVANRLNNFPSEYHIFHVIWDLLLLRVVDNEDDVDGAGVRLFD